MGNDIPVYEIALSEYTVDSQPDYKDIGAKLDQKIIEHFAGKEIILRGITVADHPGKTLDELVDIICELGHDRYDPAREGVHYPEGNGVDMHAGPWGIDGKSEVVREGVEVMWDAVGDFYEGPPSDRNGPPIRLDLLMIYAPEKLEYVPFEDWDWSAMYRFKDPANKPEALLGIIKIYR